MVLLRDQLGIDVELLGQLASAIARPDAVGRARPAAGSHRGRAARARSPHASIVLPMPTSSAMSSRTGSSLSAIISGTS